MSFIIRYVDVYLTEIDNTLSCPNFVFDHLLEKAIRVDTKHQAFTMIDEIKQYPAWSHYIFDVVKVD